MLQGHCSISSAVIYAVVRRDLCWGKLFNFFFPFSIQFKKSPPKIPYKAIALAVVLFMIGTFLIIIGALLLAGYISKGVSGLITLLLQVLYCLPLPKPARTIMFSAEIQRKRPVNKKVIPFPATLVFANRPAPLAVESFISS